MLILEIAFDFISALVLLVMCATVLWKEEDVATFIRVMLMFAVAITLFGHGMDLANRAEKHGMTLVTFLMHVSMVAAIIDSTARLRGWYGLKNG